MIKYKYMSLLIVIACLYLVVPTLASQSPSEEPFYLINVQDATGRNVPGIEVFIDHFSVGLTNTRGFAYIPQDKVFALEGLTFSAGGFFSFGTNIAAKRNSNSHIVSAQGIVGYGCARYDFPTLMSGQTPPLGMYVQLGTCNY